MPINHNDGQYALDIYPTRPRFQTEYSDNLDELKARADKLIEGGRFKYLVLYRWDADDADWKEIDEIEP